MDENIDDDGDDSNDDDVSENEDEEVNRSYYYCIVFKKQIGPNEQDEVAIEKVINFSKCFQDYLIVYKKEK
jgi:hypothetical protein